MFEITTEEIKQIESDLKHFARQALPFATRSTLNSLAFEARKEWQANISEGFVNRNAYTRRSVQVERATGLNVRTQQSVVGSTAGYMERQEYGGVANRGGRYGTVIPTAWAAGQEGARPRTKLPRAANRMKNIALVRAVRKGKFRSRRQQAFVTALLAARMGQKFVFLQAGEGADTGIFRVWGRERKRGQWQSVKMRMVYNFRKGPTQTKRTPTMHPAVLAAARSAPEMYGQALRFQLQRRGLLGY